MSRCLIVSDGFHAARTGTRATGEAQRRQRGVARGPGRRHTFVSIEKRKADLTRGVDVGVEEGLAGAGHHLELARRRLVRVVLRELPARPNIREHQCMHEPRSRGRILKGCCGEALGRARASYMVIGMHAPAQMVLSLPGMITSQLRMSCVPSGRLLGLATNPCKGAQGQARRSRGGARDGGRARLRTCGWSFLQLFRSSCSRVRAMPMTALRRRLPGPPASVKGAVQGVTSDVAVGEDAKLP